jgi:hypothetical protein
MGGRSVSVNGKPTHPSPPRCTEASDPDLLVERAKRGKLVRLSQRVAQLSRRGMVVQVKDAGGSESRAVMVQIGVLALTRKGADFPRVSQDENPWQACTLGRFTTGSLVRPAARGISVQRCTVPAKGSRHGLTTAPSAGRL